jgi:hypothetical protein
MGNNRRRNREPLSQIVDATASNDRECKQDVLPARLLRGIREALDAGGGKLRMDPQELADRLGPIIDREVQRLSRIRRARAREAHSAAMFAQAAKFFAADGHRGIRDPTPEAEDPDHG